MVTPMSSGNPFADLLGSPPSPGPGFGGQVPLSKAAPSSDPFADLMAPPSGLSPQSGAFATPSAASDAGQLPHDFDPFAAGAPAPRPAPPPVSSDPFADLMPAASNASIDAMFGLQAGPDHGDPLARFASDVPSPGQTRQESGVSTDPMAMFGASAAAPAPTVSSRRDHTPDLNAAFVPPQWSDPMAAPPRGDPDPGNQIPSDVTWLRPKPRAASAAAPVVEPPAPAAPQPTPASTPSQPFAPSPQAMPLGAAPASPFADEVVPFDLLMPAASPAASSILADFDIGAAEALQVAPTPLAPPVVPSYQAAPVGPSHLAADADVLWRAFCEGVGAPVHLHRPLDTDTMRVLGQLLTAAVAGTLQLVAVRAATKSELRADVTLIQQRANNPLKFTPDPHAGLEQLVNPPMRGFMHGPAAMTDAMNDLVGHAIGTMAGMRAALDGVLERFAPGELEGKLTGKSMLDSVLPMNRKARLWDLYLQHFATIREEAQEDFQSLFGKAFLAAYEEQLDKLRQSNIPKSK
jgi:FHA domain-containing protein